MARGLSRIAVSSSTSTIRKKPAIAMRLPCSLIQPGTVSRRFTSRWARLPGTESGQIAHQERPAKTNESAMAGHHRLQPRIVPRLRRGSAGPKKQASTIPSETERRAARSGRG